MHKTLLIAVLLSLIAPIVMAEEKSTVIQQGKASWYHEPQRLASGGRFNPEAMTAAHKTLPFGTMVRVTNLRSKHSAIVRINDRGPYRGGRIIDLSRAAARKLCMIDCGVAPVKLEIVATE